MTTVVFVHGTGTREPNYSKSLETISQELRRAGRSDLDVIGCNWGPLHGAALQAKGASIPSYHESGGRVLSLDEPITDEEYLLALWELLYQDPLVEIRMLAPALDELPETLPVRSEISFQLEEQLAQLRADASPPLQEALEAAAISDTFDQAVAEIRQSAALQTALWEVHDTTIASFRAVVARAIIAMALRHERGATDTFVGEALMVAGQRRDAAVTHTQAALGGAEPAALNPLTKIKHAGLSALAHVITGQLRQRRGFLMDPVLGFIGDILLYQGRGAIVREQIMTTIQAAQPPVVVLAHSLGGVASLDVLISTKLNDRVKLLVTIGSQAPLFYEIGALSSLPFSQESVLPPQVPPWLNIYDRRDFLSFVGAKIFPRRVKDVPVDNRQSFPVAHTSYFTNPDVWKEVLEVIDQPQRILDELE